MLQPAIKFKTELNQLMVNTYNDPYYHYFRSMAYIDFEPDIKDSTWSNLQYVSLSSSLIVLGYMQVTINRSSMNASELQLISFKKNSLEFANDFASFVCLLFGRFAIKKLCWEVVIGSPHERTYDRLLRKHNGRIVGVAEKDVVLEDGKYYDLKMYELMKDNFIESIKGTRLENRSRELYNVSRSQLT